MLAATHEKEKDLTREIARKVETALPETEVLAVELTKPDGFTVYIDDVRGVDHELCARVTDLLSDYRREWEISVSSPGIERPLRTPQHFRSVVGRRVALRTEREAAPARRGRRRGRARSHRPHADRIRGLSRTTRSCGAT